MRWKGLLIGFILVLVAGVACGHPSDGVSPGNPPGPSSPPAVRPTPGPPRPFPPSPPADSKAVPAPQADFSALPAGFPHEVWVSADGRRLYVRAEEGGCGRSGAEVREETAQHVVVSLVETRSQIRGQMCTMDIRYPVVSVSLSEPLGQRIVVLRSEERGN